MVLVEEITCKFSFRFSELPSHLIDAGFTPHSFDGIIIDTGCNNKNDKDTDILSSLEPGQYLDLRKCIDSIDRPTASDVLQHIEEKPLYKMLKIYGGLGNWAKTVATEIIEARHTFHRFQTIEVSIMAGLLAKRDFKYVGILSNG